MQNRHVHRSHNVQKDGQLGVQRHGHEDAHATAATICEGLCQDVRGCVGLYDDVPGWARMHGDMRKYAGRCEGVRRGTRMGEAETRTCVT